ncbi:MAG: hypothetical protein QOG16_797 [Actinomycetota bacterium]|jgi:hypothetical protein|nr:hypothetical protein [Actinomycetota bacterium]
MSLSDETVQPDGSATQKPTLLQSIGATIAGLLAVKLVTYIVTTVWRLITREEPPQIDQAVRPIKKAAWIALIGASTGAARQMARDKVKPPVDGAA